MIIIGRGSGKKNLNQFACCAGSEELTDNHIPATRRQSPNVEQMDMKLLTALCVLQLAAIFFLFNRITDLEAAVRNSISERPSSPLDIGDGNAGWPQQAPGDESNTVMEQRLRRIIREELAAQAIGMTGTAAVVAGATAPAISNSTAADPVQMEARRQSVTEQIDYYSSIGSISAGEMQQLQSEIATLNPSARTAALRALTGAINSGKLDGQL